MNILGVKKIIWIIGFFSKDLWNTMENFGFWKVHGKKILSDNYEQFVEKFTKIER